MNNKRGFPNLEAEQARRGLTKQQAANLPIYIFRPPAVGSRLSGERIPALGNDPAEAHKRLAAAAGDQCVGIEAIAVEAEQIGHTYETVIMILLNNAAALLMAQLNYNKQIARKSGLFLKPGYRTLASIFVENIYLLTGNKRTKIVT